MGGGKKKPTLAQMAKAQNQEDRGKGKSKSTERTASSSGGERKTLGIVPPNVKDKGVIKELQKMKVLTPYTLASRLNLRVSVAKDLLEELNRQGTVTYVSGGRNVKIYRPSESSSA